MQERVSIKSHDAEDVEKGLGVGIRFACTVGNGRQIEMTAGVPLDWEASLINSVLDKLAHSMDRQAEKYMLKDMEQQLLKCLKDLETNQTQRGRLERQFRDEHSVSGRHGDWAPKGNQSKQLDNYDNTIQHIMTMMQRLKGDIASARERCR